MAISSSSNEREFIVDGFRYAAQYWGDPSAMPVIALHGWLDNSASFSRLTDIFDGIQLLAIDLAGHGLTEHRTGYLDYPLWSEVNALCAIADKMGWKKFALLGHSRGAMIAHIMAAIVPDRISHVVLIDTLCPTPVTLDQFPNRLQKTCREVSRVGDVRSFFDSIDEAIVARCNSDYGKLTIANGELLAKRGVTQSEKGFYWHADNKLKTLPSIGLTSEHILSVLKHVRAPALALIANQGWCKRLKTAPALEKLSNDIIQENSIEVCYFDDGHFLHMENSVPAIATEIHRFLNV